MNAALKEKLDAFVENRKIITHEFKFNTDVISVGAALVFTNAGVTPNPEKMKQCRAIIKSKTKALSSFQGMMELMVLGKMSLQADPEAYLDEVLATFDMLKTGKHIEYYEEIISAMNIVNAGRFGDKEEVWAKCKDLYAAMKKEHPILTDKEDLPFVMMLALSDKKVDDIVKEIEECYDYMREHFKADKNAVQGISEVFALYDSDVKTKCDKAIRIYKLLKENGARYGKYQEFASLGVLANLDADENVLVSDIIEAADFLHNSVGFGNFSLGSSERLMFAAMATVGVYDAGMNEVGNATSSSIAMAIAEQIDILLINTMMITNIALYT